MEAQTHINDLQVPQLQALVTRYPWFSYAREVLLCKLVEIEPQCLESRYKESLVFFPMRENVFLRCKAVVAAKAAEEESCTNVDFTELLDADDQIVESQVVEPLEELSLEIDFGVAEMPQGLEEDLVIEQESAGPAVELQPVKPRVVVVGGDYFTKDDFAQLDESEKVPEIKLGAPADNVEREVGSNSGLEYVDFDSLDFVTETLAGIYADQGYYDKAIEVYAKLILLYPEKSTYFATLVNEIKSKN